MCRHETCDVSVHTLTRSMAPKALEEVFGAMSQDSRYMRYHAATPRLTSGLVRALADIDGTRHIAWQARACDRAVGLVRLVEDPDGTTELAVEVADEWSGRGIGRTLVSVALRHARERGAKGIRILVHPENRRAIRLFRAAGATFSFRDGALVGVISLMPATSAA